MDITHLHLHVRDRNRAVEFYRHWFNFAIRSDTDEITFVSGGHGFLLALMQEGKPAPMPEWFHFGVRLGSHAAVRALHDRMREEAVPLAKPLLDEPSFISFRCRDPDGYAIEIYRDT